MFKLRRGVLEVFVIDIYCLVVGHPWSLILGLFINTRGFHIQLDCHSVSCISKHGQDLIYGTLNLSQAQDESNSFILAKLSKQNPRTETNSNYIFLFIYTEFDFSKVTHLQNKPACSRVFALEWLHCFATFSYLEVLHCLSPRFTTVALKIKFVLTGFLVSLVSSRNRCTVPVCHVGFLNEQLKSKLCREFTTLIYHCPVTQVFIPYMLQLIKVKLLSFDSRLFSQTTKLRVNNSDMTAIVFILNHDTILTRAT